MVALWPDHPLALLTLALIVGSVVAAAWRRFPWAYTFMLLSVVVFAIQFMAQRLGVVCAFPFDCVTWELGFVFQAFAGGDQFWSPFSSMFVHGGVLHLFGNMIILFLVGPLLEDRIGEQWFVSIYLLAGIVGALFTVPVVLLGLDQAILQGPGGVPAAFVPVVGASGAIFGVLATFTWLYPHEKIVMPVPIGILWFMRMPAWIAMILFLGLNVLSVVSGDNVAWWGHLGGFLVGLVFAVVVPRREAAKAKGDVDLEALRPLARDEKAEEILGHIEHLNVRKTKDDAVYQEAWIERYFGHVRCPRCEGPFALEEDVASSDCGYEVKVRTK